MQLDFAFEHGGLVELVLCGQRDQLVVGDAAPQEKGKTGGESKIADAVILSRFHRGGLGFLAEIEFRVNENAAYRHLDPVVEVAARITPDLVEAHQHFRILIGDGAAEGVAG